MGIIYTGVLSNQHRTEEIYAPSTARPAYIDAEEVGFEPTVPRGTTVFKTAAFDHSATPPLNNHDNYQQFSSSLPSVKPFTN